MKMSSLWTKQQASIGLDIGSSGIKMVVLEKTGREKLLKKFSYLNNTPGLDIAAVLKSFIGSFDLSEPRVNISVSGQSVMMRYINLPQMTIQELKSTMQFEAKQYIPFALDEMVLDCAILKEKLEGNKMLVVLAAIKKTALEERLSLIEKAGCSVNLIDLDCFCLANAFSQSAVTSKDESCQKTIGLLNLGARSTNMAIMDDLCLRFSRDIAFGGQEPALQKLAVEINSSVDYYENQNGKAIEKIYLSGGTSFNPQTTSFLTQQLNIPVAAFEVFSGLPLDPSIDRQKLNAEGSLFAVALGLALR